MTTIRKASGIEYTLRRNRGQRNLRLHIDPSGSVIVSAPYYASYGEVDAFVSNSSEWIKKHVGKVSRHSYSTGDFVPYLGRKMTLMVIESDSSLTSKMARYDIVDDKIIITTQNGDIEKIKAAIKRLYCETVLDIMEKRVPFWCRKLDVPDPRFGVNRAKGKWGVCYPSERRLYLSYMCATLPTDLIDMTILHECCHLLHSGHGKDFWDLMKSNMPDLEERKARLAALAKSGWNLNIV